MCLDPVRPSAAVDVPGAVFFHGLRVAFVTGHHIDLIALNDSAQHRLWPLAHDPLTQLLGHTLNVILIQAQLARNLPIRQVYTISL